MKEIDKKVLRAALYIRVSSEEQVRHGYSLNSQKERLIEYCKQQGYKVTKIYTDEGKSARTKLKNRKELIKLVEDAKEKKFDRVIFWRLDRWFRNIADYYKIQEILDVNHIDWECSDEEYNTTTSNGRLHLNIKLSIAQNESDQTGDRIRFNFSSMIKNGRAIQGSHCMPLGYKVDGEEKNKHVIKNEDDAVIVEDMFEHFSAYSSIRKTLIYINEKYNRTIHYDCMRNYIKNELYTGKYKDIENYCEPYISKEQFVDNLTKIKRNVKTNEKKYDYIFSSLIKCRCCGYNMSGFTHRTTRPKYNRVYKNHAYRCNRSYNSKLCENRSPILEHKLEDYLLNNIQNDLKNYIIDVESISNVEIKKVVDVKQIKNKIDRLSELYIDGKISKEKYDNDYSKFKESISSFEQTEKVKRDLSIYDSLLDNTALEIYNKLNNDSKRAFWSRYIDYIERDEQLKFIVHFK